MNRFDFDERNIPCTALNSHAARNEASTSWKKLNLSLGFMY